MYGRAGRGVEDGGVSQGSCLNHGLRGLHGCHGSFPAPGGRHVQRNVPGNIPELRRSGTYASILAILPSYESQFGQEGDAILIILLQAT